MEREHSPARMHVAIIDSNPRRLALIEGWSGEAGCAPTAYERPEDALRALLDGAEPDVIVVGFDHDVPQASRLVRLLRSETFSPWAHIPIVLACECQPGLGGTGFASRARRVGVYVATWDRTSFQRLLQQLASGDVPADALNMLIATPDLSDCVQPPDAFLQELHALGYTPHVLGGVHQSQEALETTPFAVALVDQRLVDDSPELLPRIHASQPQCPTLVWSRGATPDQCITWFSQGALDHVPVGTAADKLAAACHTARADRMMVDTVSELTHRSARLEEQEVMARHMDERSREVFYRQDLRSGRFTHISPKVEQLLGWTGDEIRALSFEDQLAHLHPEDAPRLASFDADLIEADERGEPYIERRFRIRAKDGAYHWIHGSYILVRDDSGEPESVVGTLDDITDQVHTQAELEAAKDLLDRAQQLSKTGAWQMDMVTGESSITENWRRILGVPSRDIGWEEYQSVIHADDLATVQKAFADALAGPEPYHCEHRIVRRDGTERIIHCRGHVTRDTQGQPIKIVGVSQDVTQERRVERALEESEARFRAIVHRSPVSVLALRNGRYIFTNPAAAEMLGYASPQEIVGLDALSTVAPEQHATIRERMQHTQLGQVNPPIELQLVRPDGTRVWTNSTSVPILLDGEPTTLIVGHNVTKEIALRQALAESEARFREMVSSAPMAVLATRDGRYTYANPAAAKLLGYAAADSLTGKSILETIAPDQREQVRVRLAHAAQGSANPVLELQMLRADGERVWLRASSAPVELGGQPSVLVVGQDVTEARRARLALRQSQENLSALLDAIPDSALLISEEGMVLAANDTVAQRMGKTRDEFVGTNAYDNLPEHVADRRRAWTRQIVAAGEPAQVIDERFGRTVRSSLYPIPGDAHHEGRVAIVSVDITETMEHEAELARRLSAMEASLDAIAIISHDDRIIYANQAASEILGETTEALDQRNWRDLYEPEEQRRFQEVIVPQVNQTGHWRGEVTGRHLDGTPMPQELSLTLIENGDYVCVMRDITERKNAESEFRQTQEQLLQAQKMESVGRLAGGVAHDFNNMLTVILGHTDMALEDVSPDSELYETLVEIRQAGQRSADLTKQLLAYARKQTIVPEVLDLNATVEDMLRMLRRLIGEDISLGWLPGSGLWHVSIDPSQVNQIMANLCVNARDAIDGHGKVTIQTSNMRLDEPSEGVAPGEYVCLSVTDTGSGMDEETLNQLFEPFFTTKEIGEGTGLGLATVQGIVAQNDGAIVVHSQVGEGTSLSIYLPRHKQAPSADQEDPSQDAAPGRGTILLVEDEPAILRMAQLGLERAGYRVIAMPTPGQAISAAREYASAIDLLVTDMIMPEMTGRELARTVLEICPSARVLFMTGYSGQEPLHVDAQGRDTVLVQKPFNVVDLAAQVKALLDHDDAG